jgi:hypothetical protein
MLSGYTSATSSASRGTSRRAHCRKYRFSAWRWKKMGYEGKDGMLTRFGKPVPLAEERDLFQLLQLPWVQPNDR